MSIVQKPSEFFEHLQKEHGHTDTPENLIKIVKEQEKEMEIEKFGARPFSPKTFKYNLKGVTEELRRSNGGVKKE